MASNLTQRIFTGVIAGAAALTLTLYDPLTFLALLLVATILCVREWLHIGKHIYPQSNKSRLVFAALFVPYVMPCILCLAWLRCWPEEGNYLVLGVFALVWTTDIAAYACGRIIGGPKIAPRISPSKTWAGLIGAMLATAGMAALLAQNMASLPLPVSLISGAILAIVAQAGDFFESWLKRRAGLKDSGNLLPGHGGILDRIDGMIPAVPLYTAIILLFCTSAH